MSQQPDQLSQALDQLADDLTALASVDSRLGELVTRVELNTGAIDRLTGVAQDLLLVLRIQAQGEHEWRQTITDLIVSIVNEGHGYVNLLIPPLVSELKSAHNAHVGALSEIGAGVADVYATLVRFEQRYSLAADDDRQAGGSIAAALDDVAGAIRNHP